MCVSRLSNNSQYLHGSLRCWKYRTILIEGIPDLLFSNEKRMKKNIKKSLDRDKAMFGEWNPKP